MPKKHFSVWSETFFFFRKVPWKLYFACKLSYIIIWSMLILRKDDKKNCSNMCLDISWNICSNTSLNIFWNICWNIFWSFGDTWHIDAFSAIELNSTHGRKNEKLISLIDFSKIQYIFFCSKNSDFPYTWKRTYRVKTGRGGMRYMSHIHIWV